MKKNLPEDHILGDELLRGCCLRLLDSKDDVLRPTHSGDFLINCPIQFVFTLKLPRKVVHVRKLDIFPQVRSCDCVGDSGGAACSGDDGQTLPVRTIRIDNIQIGQPKVAAKDDNLSTPGESAAGDVSQGSLKFVKVPPVK